MKRKILSHSEDANFTAEDLLIITEELLAEEGFDLSIPINAEVHLEDGYTIYTQE